MVTKYAETGANSAGTAMEKYDIVLDSVSAKQEQLNAKVQEFYMNLLNSGLFKGLLDFGSSVMNIANAFDGLVAKFALATIASVALGVALKALKATKLGGTISAWISMLMGMSTAEDVTAMKAMTLKGVLDLLKAHPIVFLLSAITTALTIGAIAWDAYNKKIQESIDKANELTETYKNTSKELNDNIKSLELSSDTKTYKTLQDEFDYLTKGVDAYGNNLGLTNEEYARYLSICEQIVGLNPDLMEGYESEAEAIGNKNDALQNTIELLEQEARLKAQEYVDSADDVLEGAQNKYDKELGKTSTDFINNNLALEENMMSSIGEIRDNLALVSGMYQSTIQEGIKEVLPILGQTREGVLSEDAGNIIKQVDEAIDKIKQYKHMLEIFDTGTSDDDTIKALDQTLKSLQGLKANANKRSSLSDNTDATKKRLKDELANSMDEVWKAVLLQSEKYGDLDGNTKHWLNQYIVDNFSINEKSTEKTIDNNINKINHILDAISGNNANAKDARKKLSELFTLDLDETKYSDYRKKIEEVAKLIAKITGQSEKKIKISLGLDTNNQDDIEGLDKIEKILIQKIFPDDDFKTANKKIRKYLGEMSKASVDALLDMDETTLKSVKSLDDLGGRLLNLSSNVESMDSVFSNYANNLQSLTEQYEILREAQDEYNEYGNLSAKTMQGIIDNGLLEYLETENGLLTFNTQKLQEDADAQHDDAIEKLQNALFTDLHSIALGTYQEAMDATDEENANTALKNFQTELSNTTDKALETATAITALNSALGSNYKFDSDKQKEQADKVVQNYNDMVNKVKTLSTDLHTNYNNNRNGSGGSSGSKSSSKSTKEWWEKQLETLKDNLDYNVITMDAYINGLEGILGKLKKGSDAWKEVNAELQKAKLEQVENQFDRGEITVDQYIKKLEELRKGYKKNTEGYKELTDTINDAKYDKFANQYERGEITADQYIKKLQSLQIQYKKGSEEYKKLADEIDEIQLEKTEKYLDKLDEKIDDIDQKIDRLGDVNTDKESIKYAELLSQKYKQVQKNIASIKKQLANTNLTQEQREALQERLNDLLVEEVDIRDEIEDQVREYYENQKEQAEQQAELNRKETLYQKELELYGKKGKELYEWETNQKIKAIEEQIELREAEKEALDEINEREQLENDLLEAKLKLQNALNNKTTKILKKQADGTWQYEYSANMVDVKSAKEEIENAEKALADFDFEQGIQELRDQADKLSKEMEDLGDKYDEAEFWADREYEQTMNGIEKAYGDIDAMVEKWMKTYGGDVTKLTEGYQSVVSANNTLEQSIINLTTAIESKYETVGVNKVSSKDGVKSFDTGGKIVGNGLILAHDKERVLTEQQNLYFESFVSKLPQLLKAVDVTKFSGYRGGKTFGSRVNADKANSTVINKVECVFPNITSTDGLQKAILELPRLALQNK